MRWKILFCRILQFIYVAVSICRRFDFLILFLTPFSFVAVELLRYERYEKSKDGKKSLRYEKSGSLRMYAYAILHKWFLPRAASAESGDASVCPSVTLMYDFHIGWNSSKIISRRIA